MQFVLLFPLNLIWLLLWFLKGFVFFFNFYICQFILFKTCPSFTHGLVCVSQRYQIILNDWILELIILLAKTLFMRIFLNLRRNIQRSLCYFSIFWHKTNCSDNDLIRARFYRRIWFWVLSRSKILICRTLN